MHDGCFIEDGSGDNKNGGGQRFYDDCSGNCDKFFHASLPFLLLISKQNSPPIIMILMQFIDFMREFL